MVYIASVLIILQGVDALRAAWVQWRIVTRQKRLALQICAINYIQKLTPQIQDTRVFTIAIRDPYVVVDLIERFLQILSGDQTDKDVTYTPIKLPLPDADIWPSIPQVIFELYKTRAPDACFTLTPRIRNLPTLHTSKDSPVKITYYMETIQNGTVVIIDIHRTTTTPTTLEYRMLEQQIITKIRKALSDYKSTEFFWDTPSPTVNLDSKVFQFNPKRRYD
jgi:hypothetical protein